MNNELATSLSQLQSDLSALTPATAAQTVITLAAGLYSEVTQFLYAGANDSGVTIVGGENDPRYTIIDNTFSGAPALTIAGNNITVENLTFQDQGTAVDIAGGYSNTVQSDDFIGVNQGVVVNNSSYNNIAFNNFLDIGDNAVQIIGGFYNIVGGNQINNVSSGYDTVPTLDGVGVAVSGRAQETQIEYNVINGTGGAAIAVDDSAGQVSQLAISANNLVNDGTIASISGAPQAAILLVGTGTQTTGALGSTVDLLGNYIQQQGAELGIVETAAISNVQILDNTFENEGSATASITDGYGRDNIVNDNLFLLEGPNTSAITYQGTTNPTSGITLSPNQAAFLNNIVVASNSQQSPPIQFSATASGTSPTITDTPPASFNSVDISYNDFDESLSNSGDFFDVPGYAALNGQASNKGLTDVNPQLFSNNFYYGATALSRATYGINNPAGGQFGEYNPNAANLAVVTLPSGATVLSPAYGNILPVNNPYIWVQYPDGG